MKPEARETSGWCLFGKKTLISRVDRGSWRGLNLNRYTWAPVTAAKGRRGGERRARQTFGASGLGRRDRKGARATTDNADLALATQIQAGPGDLF